LNILMKTLLTTLFLCVSLGLFADDFKVKLEIDLVDHSTISGAMVTVMNNGELSKSEKVGNDGQVKLVLESGLLYDVWIQKSGYTSHVIHNVHSEGDGKFKITLYKQSKTGASFDSYKWVNRTFDDVKKMTIPVEHLGEDVNVINEDALTKEESKDISAVEKLGKSQRKTQKKIDKYTKSAANLEKDIDKLTDKIADGSVEKLSGEEDKLKLQEKLVKVQKSIAKLAY